MIGNYLDEPTHASRTLKRGSLEPTKVIGTYTCRRCHATGNNLRSPRQTFSLNDLRSWLLICLSDEMTLFTIFFQYLFIMAPWDILFAVKKSDPVARVQAFIDGYKNIPDYEVCSFLTTYSFYDSSPVLSMSMAKTNYRASMAP